MNKKAKVYIEGDVITARLSKKSGIDKNVLEWINAHDNNDLSKAIIDAIKLTIRENTRYETAVTITRAEELKPKVKTNNENSAKTPIVVNKNGKAAEDEIFNNKDKSDNVSPMSKALRSIGGNERKQE